MSSGCVADRDLEDVNGTIPRKEKPEILFGCCRPEYLSLKYAEAALSSLNEKRRETKDSEYKLVEALDHIPFEYPWIAHCNFIIEPINGTEGERKLAFAEVKSQATSYKRFYGRIVRSCTFYSILEPTDSKASTTEKKMGLSGCKCCDRYPGRIQHPENGFTSDDNLEMKESSYNDDYVDYHDYMPRIRPQKKIHYEWDWENR